MAGAAGRRGDGRRQEGNVPDGCPVGAAGISARHLGPVTVDVGAGASGDVVARDQSAGLRQWTPDKVGGAIHVGGCRQGDAAVTVAAVQSCGQVVAARDVRGMGANLDVGVRGDLGWVRGAIEWRSGCDSTRSAAAVAFTTLVGGGHERCSPNRNTLSVAIGSCTRS